MKTIYKYQFSMSSDKEEFEMPSASFPLSVGEQNGLPCMWCQVETNNPIVTRKFRIVGTGHEIPETVRLSKYVGTVQIGVFVWHIFEEEVIKV